MSLLSLLRPILARATRAAVTRVCRAVAARLPVRVITGGDDTPYLSKYRLRDGGRDGVSVHLHRFHRGDADRELHNHPWAWGASLVLVGGYDEHRLVGGHDEPREVRVFARRPGDVNLIGSATYHRVVLRDGECWTLFVTGRIVKSWGFLDTTDWTFTPWRDFIRAKGGVPQEPWLARREGERQ